MMATMARAATTSDVFNAIPAVCEAPSGLLGPLDVPRYWTRNRPARPAAD